ncbi:MAG: hypothetical protein LBH85_03390 [Treponema sp.]|nr:hypothetical protein [Treponema sp.]
MEQRHLGHKDTVNHGSYYTPAWLVDIVYSLIGKNAPEWDGYYILDTSCGYGGFLRGAKTIGVDVDEKAVETAEQASPQRARLKQICLIIVMLMCLKITSSFPPAPPLRP